MGIEISSVEQVTDDLNEEMENAVNWFDNNPMSVNIGKTKAFFVSSAQKQSHIQGNTPEIKIGTAILEVSNKEKLLRVIIDNTLNRSEGRADFSDQFRKIIVRSKRIGYNINIMRQSACLVFNPITVNNFASLFNCMPVGRASLIDGPDIKLSILVGWGRSFFVRCLAHRGSTVGFLLLQCFSGLLDTPGISRCRTQHVSVESSSRFHHSKVKR